MCKTKWLLNLFKLVWKEILDQTQLAEKNSERVFLIFVHMQFQEIFCETFAFHNEAKVF